MSDVLAQFHPLIQEWFRSRFEAPTGAQAEGWPAIARGTHTLVAAPTGSGKTLAAFMTCLDRLVRAGLEGGLPETTEVVYVSPLKALANDIERNLTGPLAEIGRLAEERGTPLPEIRVGLRTGDTPASKRQAMAKRPPHMLVTTPESLYILLTSESGRRGLTGVRTLILDELHAVADDKRGSHLSLSVERLCRLAHGPITRIGLSATQRPIEEVGRFLVGAANIAPDGKPDCLIVDTGHSREMDLALELPEDEIGPIATHEQWDHALDRVADLVRAHHTTILFVNTRRLVERLAHQMSERLGEKAVAAHHGSLSQEIRRDAEQRLKAGKVKVCVATASLELGIDVGAVDLVCQVGSPRSIGLLLQRVGRSGHYLGRHTEGPALSPDAGRADRVHGPRPGHTAAKPGHPVDSTLAARRAGPADRGRVRRGGAGRGRAVRARPASLPVPGASPREVRRGGRHALPWHSAARGAQVLLRAQGRCERQAAGPQGG